MMNQKEKENREISPLKEERSP